MNNPFESIETRLDGIENLILDLKHNPNKESRAKESDNLLSRDEACKFLKVNSSTLWAWTNKGKVKAYGIGNRRYYKRSELIEALTPLNEKG